MTLVEKIGAAIGMHLVVRYDLIADADDPIKAAAELTHACAIAALRAMRDPSEGMLDAGAEASAFVENGWELLRPWQAMIDQAIKEGSE